MFSIPVQNCLVLRPIVYWNLPTEKDRENPKPWKLLKSSGSTLKGFRIVIMNSSFLDGLCMQSQDYSCNNFLAAGNDREEWKERAWECVGIRWSRCAMCFCSHNGPGRLGMERAMEARFLGKFLHKAQWHDIEWNRQGLWQNHVSSPSLMSSKSLSLSTPKDPGELIEMFLLIPWVYQDWALCQMDSIADCGPGFCDQVSGDNNVCSTTRNWRGSELGGHTCRLTCISDS